MAAYTVVDDSSKYFQAEIYDGAGASQQVTFSGNSDLQPDLLWIKRRNAGYGHNMFDTYETNGHPNHLLNSQT